MIYFDTFNGKLRLNVDLTKKMYITDNDDETKTDKVPIKMLRHPLTPGIWSWNITF